MYFVLLARYLEMWTSQKRLHRIRFAKRYNRHTNFGGDCDIRVWLCQIAKNDYYNYLRKEKRNVSGFVEEDVFLNVPDTAEPAIDRIEDAEEAEEIRSILENMEEPYKTVFSLKVLHEVSYQKIAEVYGKTESWARVTFYRAKAKILDALKEL